MKVISQQPPVKSNFVPGSRVLQVVVINPQGAVSKLGKVNLG